MTAPSHPGKRRLRRRLMLGVFLLIGTWLVFFDSHSLYRRYDWYRERARLQAENETLRQEIETLRKKLDQGLSDERVEHIAREQYGMRRPGETVYRIEMEE